MSADFDPTSGRLRCVRAELDALVAWAAGERADPAVLDGLEVVGVVERGRPHPRLAPLLAALAEPVALLHCESSGSTVVEGGVVPGLTALAVRRSAGTGDDWDLFGADPSFLPAVVARVVVLGPRRRTTDEPRQLSPDELAERCAAPGHVRWTATATWSRPDGPSGRQVDVLDHSPVGLWLLEPAADRTVAWPTTPTMVWRALCTLLPSDDELGGTL